MASVKPKPKSSRSPPSHPPFHDMITDAIATMKERNGSSQAAIRKFIEEKYGKRLPLNFRKNLILQLKRLVASGKLVKVKNSFKVQSGVRSSTRSKRSSTRKDMKDTKAGVVRKTAKSPMAKNKKKKEVRMGKQDGGYLRVNSS